MNTLDRIEAIIAENSDDNHIELMEINARLLPRLRALVEADDQWEQAAAVVRRMGSVDVTGVAVEMDRSVRALLASLRGEP